MVAKTVVFQIITLINYSLKRILQPLRKLRAVGVPIVFYRGAVVRELAVSLACRTLRVADGAHTKDRTSVT